MQKESYTHENASLDLKLFLGRVLQTIPISKSANPRTGSLP
jgi:hypothetical protein